MNSGIKHKNTVVQSGTISITLPFVESYPIVNQSMKEANAIARLFLVDLVEGAFTLVKSRKKRNNKHESNFASSSNRGSDIEEVLRIRNDKPGEKTLVEKEVEIVVSRSRD